MKGPKDTAAAAFLAAIVDSSDDAIVGKSLEGTILTWNAGAARIFGYKEDEIVGRSIRTLIPADRQDEEDTILASIRRGDSVPRFETIRLRKDGSEVHISVTVSPVLDSKGQVIAASKIARDITERKRVQAALAESEQRFRLLADNISQLAWIADSKGWIFWYNQRWFDYTGTTLEEMEGWGWKTVHHPDHVDRVVERVQHSWDTGEIWEDTFPLRGVDGQYRWFLSRALPIRNEDGDIEYWFGTNTDVTEMREAEERIQLLLREVNHRSKNMLAIVQSLARRSSPDREGFIERLEQRIQGLAANQDLLVSTSWSSVPMRDLVEAQLRFLGDSARQCELDGPQVMISPGPAESLGMALHELATNALKYGALSVADGKVAIRWDVDHAGDQPEFRMEWAESDGPLVAEPDTRGFGSMIIDDIPRSRLNGDIVLDYSPSGLRWALSCPKSRVCP